MRRGSAVWLAPLALALVMVAGISSARTITVGPSNSLWPTPQVACESLNTKTYDENMVFEIEAGDYPGACVLTTKTQDPITVTFRPQVAGSIVRIYTVSDLYTWNNTKINKLKVEGLYISGQSTASGAATIRLSGVSGCCFRGDSITGCNGSSTAANYAVFFDGTIAGTTDDSIVACRVSISTAQNNSYAIYVQGTNSITRPVIKGCLVGNRATTGANGAGIGTSAGTVNGYILNDTITGLFPKGIYAIGGGNLTITGCVIQNNGASSSGIYLGAGTGHVVANNFVKGWTGTGGSSQAGILVSTADNYFYYNTVVGPNVASSYCVSIGNSAPRNTFKNNIFFCSHSGAYCYYTNTGSYQVYASNNNLYFTGGYVAKELATNLDLTAWRAKSGNPDQNGAVLTNPNFAVDGIHLQSASDCIGNAATGTGVSDDIDGDLRSTGFANPDMGADEFAPMAFALTSPANNPPEPQELELNLEWQTSTNATGYDIYYGTPTLPGTPNVSDWTSTTLPISGLSGNSNYVWRVVAKYLDHSRNCNADFNFTTIVAAPGAFNLLTPDDGETGVAVAGDLTWEESVGADCYDVYLGTDYPLDLLHEDVENTTCSYSGLLPETEYFWAVVAKNANPAPTRCTEDFDFTTIIAAPGAFNLLTPDDGETGIAVAGDLTWEESVGADCYDVYLGTDYPLDLLHEDVENTTCSYSGLLPETEYFWAVVAKNANPTPTRCTEDFDFTTELGIYRDVGPTAIIVPAGNVLLGAEVFPKVTVENFGEQEETFMLEVKIESPADAVWQEEEEIVALAVGESRDYTFVASWTAEPLGDYTVTATTKLVGDQEPENDVKGPNSFSVTEAPQWPDGWVRTAPMPNTEPSSSKPVKDGGWLAIGPDQVTRGQRDKGTMGQSEGRESGHSIPQSLDPLTPSSVIYAAKGNKTLDFFKYNPDENVWTALKDIPLLEGEREKPPKKGCRGISDNDNSVYMTKGNNTLGFWHYDISLNEWTPLAGVPEGPDRKKVKGGTDMVYVPEGKPNPGVYLLKGYRNEFYRYTSEVGEPVWQELPPVPFGANKKKYAEGSFLVYDGVNTIYVHQAKYTDALKQNHFMFKFDLEEQKWALAETLPGMPVLGLEGGKEKKKKSKDGAAGAWYDGCMYALKGGNTEQYWKYTPGAETAWTQLDPVPLRGDSTEKKKRVKYGADLVSYGSGAFFALKGNKTLDLWRYVIPAEPSGRPDRSGVMARNVEVRTSKFELFPKLIANGFALLRIQGIKDSRNQVAEVRVFDAAGRCVLTRPLGYLTTGSLPLDLRKLPAGVYLVRLDAGGFTATGKLVVQR